MARYRFLEKNARFRWHQPVPKQNKMSVFSGNTKLKHTCGDIPKIQLSCGVDTITTPVDWINTALVLHCTTTLSQHFDLPLLEKCCEASRHENDSNSKTGGLPQFVSSLQSIKTQMIDSDVEIDHDYVVAEKIDDPVVIQKRGKRKLNSCDPDVAGVLDIIVHLITSTSTGDQLTKSRKSIPILIEKGELYVENIDLLNARNNIHLSSNCAWTNRESFWTVCCGHTNWSL